MRRGFLVQICCYAGEVQHNPPWGSWSGGQQHGVGCLIFDASHGFDVFPHSFCGYLKRSAMSACTHTTATRHFPGNCTLEMALNTIVDVYHRYSIREKQFDYLSFNDFKTLLTEQAPIFLEACGRNHHNYLRKLFEETDLNKDKDVSFKEFTIVLAKVTDDAHRIIHGDERCTPDKD
ncbi:protein S100-A7-like [Morus bassanus]